MHDQPNAGRPSTAVRAYGTMNTLHALEALAAGPVSAPELASALGVAVTTARRVLRRLAVEGYAEQGFGHRRRYTATPRLAALGRLLIANSPLVLAACPSLAGLADATDGVARVWIPAEPRAAGGALAVLTAVPGAAPEAHLAEIAPPSHPAAAVLAGGRGELAAPIVAGGRPIAAVTLTGTSAGAAGESRLAAATGIISDVLRDGVF